jgi:hypothetical protein
LAAPGRAILSVDLDTVTLFAMEPKNPGNPRQGAAA